MIVTLPKVPKVILDRLQGQQLEMDNIGMSSANVYLFQDLVLKVEDVSPESKREHQSYQWLAGKLPVPEIVESLEENQQHYLLMRRLSGEFACAEKWLQNPQALVQLLAKALQMLWQIPIEDCPMDASLRYKLKEAEYNVRHHLCDVEDAEEGTYGDEGFESPKALLEWLQSYPPEEDWVFSHGDFCLPNIFLKEREISGFIDLGRSGIADRYQDIALCYRSLLHNFDGGYNGGISYPNFDPKTLFEALNIEPDWDKINYYILLDELF